METLHKPDFGTRSPILYISGEKELIEEFLFVPRQGTTYEDAIAEWEDFCDGKEIEFEVLRHKDE